MSRNGKSFLVEALVLLMALGGLLALSEQDGFAAGHGGKKESLESDKKHTDKKEEAVTAVLWRDPSDIATRDLFYGPGGQADQPQGTFTFVEEDLNGTNPKIVAQDQDGVKWTVKLGAEARPETAATRLTWAIGYFANEDYFMHDLKVQNVPAHLHRGRSLIASDGSMHDVRLKRHLPEEKKIKNWAWRNGAFGGTRELNGLRVLMAVMNNWDLTDDNNAVYLIKKRGESAADEQIYMVSDLGSTFGSGRLTWPMSKDRGNLRTYSHSKFITRMTADSVDFFVPTRPAFFFLATPREFVNKLHLRWIGKQIPRGDAKWLGQQLGRLSPGQIRDAFRAAEYTPAEIDGFAAVIQARISALEEL